MPISETDQELTASARSLKTGNSAVLPDSRALAARTDAFTAPFAQESGLAFEALARFGIIPIRLLHWSI